MPTPTSEQRYLELMKQTLCYRLWPEPARAVDPDEVGNRFKRWVLKQLRRLLQRRNMQIVRSPRVSAQARDEGRIWPGLADTMIGLRRLDNLQQCLESVLRERIPGDLIETGVWRGGASIFMRAVLAAHAVADRRVYVADSFRGLPPPDTTRYPADAGDDLHTYAELAVDRATVEANFAKYGLLDQQVVFVEGWFADTLPALAVKEFALIRLDGDMYGSTMDALEALYPKLAVGGYCIIDDYALPGCRRAVEDYRQQNGIVEPLQEVDWTGVCWRRRS